jgi:hypothetical protein
MALWKLWVVGFTQPDNSKNEETVGENEGVVKI